MSEAQIQAIALVKAAYFVSPQRKIDWFRYVSLTTDIRKEVSSK